LIIPTFYQVPNIWLPIVELEFAYLATNMNLWQTMCVLHSKCFKSLNVFMVCLTLSWGMRTIFLFPSSQTWSKWFCSYKNFLACCRIQSLLGLHRGCKFSILQIFYNHFIVKYILETLDYSPPSSFVVTIMFS